MTQRAIQNGGGFYVGGFFQRMKIKMAASLLSHVSLRVSPLKPTPLFVLQKSLGDSNQSG